MKTIRFFGVALFTVLLSVGLSSCSKSDDDNGGEVSASIEGTWYLKAEKWFTDESMTTVKKEKTYGDYANERIWTFKKSGDDLILTQESGSTREYTLIKNGNNDYQKGNDRFVVKTLTTNSLIVDIYDNYYDKEEYKEYGTYIFMR